MLTLGSTKKTRHPDPGKVQDTHIFSGSVHWEPGSMHTLRAVSIPNARHLRIKCHFHEKNQSSRQSSPTWLKWHEPLKKNLLNWTSLKFKTLTLKKTAKRMKWQATRYARDWERARADHTVNKDPAPRIRNFHNSTAEKKKPIQSENGQKTWTVTSPKKWEQISTWKAVHHHLSLGKCKLKPQQDITTPIRTAKWKTVVTPNGEKDIEKRDPSYFAAGNKTWYGHSGKQSGSCSQN